MPFLAFSSITSSTFPLNQTLYEYRTVILVLHVLSRTFFVCTTLQQISEQQASVRFDFGATRFGDHALALLSEIAELGAQSGKLKAPESWASSSPNAASAYWVRKWKQEVSGWLQARGRSRSPCLTLFFARHLVPPCMGPKLRTLGL